MKKSSLEEVHKPVLLDEVLAVLRADELAHLHSNARIIDATLGYGGHSSELVKRGLYVFGIDADKKALLSAKEKLSKACPTPQKTERCFEIIHGNFRKLDQYIEERNLSDIFGVLLDLGVSSPQLTSLSRGFSFQNPQAELDMRMDPENQSVTAADLLNSLPEDHLFRLFEPFMDYKQAKQLTKMIVLKRSEKPFIKVKDLLEIVEENNFDHKSINKATLPFMAIRIAVNTELEDLSEVLPKAFTLLEKSGRLAVITFHSGEDRIVKNFFKKKVENNQAIYPGKKFIKPDEVEVKDNPRARSAKLRYIEKK